MHNFVLGVRHSTANTDVRDPLALEGERGDDFSRRILEFSWCREVVLLSTCNCTEIYAVLSVEPAEVQAKLMRTWCEFTGNSSRQIQRCTYYYAHADAVRHLYRVVSSLNSLVVGETQILERVEEAFSRAEKNGFVQLHMNQLFQSAFALGKSIRSDTEINQESDNCDKGLQASQAIEAIITERVSEYTRWYHSRKVVPVIKNLRKHFSGIAESELAKHRNRFNREQLEAVEEVLHGVTEKWLHHPLEEITTLSEKGLELEACAFLSRLFQLPVELPGENEQESFEKWDHGKPQP